MKKLLLAICVLSAGNAVAGTKNPQDLMDRARTSGMKRVEVQFDRPIDEIAVLIENDGRRCSGSDQVIAVIPAPVVIDRNMALVEGSGLEGSRWFGFLLSNKIAAVLHWPIELYPVNGNVTRAVLYDVKPKQADDRKQKILAGGYFCPL
jgi:hypothetical protein